MIAEKGHHHWVDDLSLVDSGSLLSFSPSLWFRRSFHRSTAHLYLHHAVAVLDRDQTCRPASEKSIGNSLDLKNQLLVGRGWNFLSFRSCCRCRCSDAALSPMMPKSQLRRQPTNGIRYRTIGDEQRNNAARQSRTHMPIMKNTVVWVVCGVFPTHEAPHDATPEAARHSPFFVVCELDETTL